MDGLQGRPAHQQGQRSAHRLCMALGLLGCLGLVVSSAERLAGGATRPNAGKYRNASKRFSRRPSQASLHAKALPA